MFIRPYIISQTTLLLLALFLLLYLSISVRHTAREKLAHTRWMIQAIAWNVGVLLLFLVIGLTENPQLDLLAYFRDPFGLLALHAMVQAIYATPPHEPFVRRQEPRIMARSFLLLFSLEIGYLIFRIWSFYHTGTIQPKLFLLRLPILLIAIWLLLLVIRKLWIAEAGPGLSTRQHLHRIFISPQHNGSPFYRGVLLFTGMTIFMISLFVVTVTATTLPPTWLLVTADSTVTISFLSMLFAYLVSGQVHTGLEIRLIGAGLTIFLALISVLGWIITLTFLHHQAPDVHPVWIFGTQMQTQFFVTPDPYRPLARMLSSLLAPLIGFSAGGSLIFVWLYTSYYRSTLKVSLAQIVTGFLQVRQGNLAYRVPHIAWQDEFSQIAIAFNQMAASLEEAYVSLYAYQEHLQTLVDQRTAQLGEEMEMRKQLELRQAIQDERTRIAQETHDGLLQTLMGIRIRLNRGKQLSQRESAVIQAELAELSGEISRSILELRNLIHELNDQILPEGLIPALRQSIRHHEQTYSIIVHTHLNYPTGLLPLNQELHILRIIQEALSNASRHGHATEAWISIDYSHQEDHHTALHVQVCDNGQGFDQGLETSAGWGLKNMHQRAKQLGTQLHIQSQPGIKTLVSMTLSLEHPLPVPDNQA